MGLRLRLNLLLSLIFFVALAAGAAYALDNARRAVVDELQASTDLASTLIQGLFDAAADEAARVTVASMLEQLEGHAQTRHLSIVVAHPATASVQERADDRSPNAVPAWFFALVRPEPGRLTRAVAFADRSIVIAADARDEIAEAWRETKAQLAVLLGVFVVANGVVYLFLGRALAPLDNISLALTGIERGNYAARADRVALPDMDGIAERFNLMAEALERSHADNAMLAQRSLAIQEQERRHLAHELHDEMGQSITAIKALAVSIQERSEQTDSTVANSAATITEVSGDIYASVRQMMTRLHPVILDELGLVSAVELMVDDWNTHHDECFCSFHAARDFPRLDDKVRIGIYRIVQEALTNIAKHANAREAHIRLDRNSNTEGGINIVVDVSDNGVGFDLAERPRGLGLVGIQERVNAMHGDFEIEAQPERGVHLRVSAPLDFRSGLKIIRGRADA